MSLKWGGEGVAVKKVTPEEQECVKKLLIILRSQDERLSTAVSVYLDLLYQRVLTEEKSGDTFKHLRKVLENLSRLSFLCAMVAQV